MQGVKDKGFRPLIVEIDAHLKSRMLDAPKKMTKPQLKKWAPAKAIEILTARGDHATAKLIATAGKADDHGDAVCYDEVWWRILAGGLHAPPPVQLGVQAVALLQGTTVKTDRHALAQFMTLPLPDETHHTVPGRRRVQVVSGPPTATVTAVATLTAAFSPPATSGLCPKVSSRLQVVRKEEPPLIKGARLQIVRS